MEYRHQFQCKCLCNNFNCWWINQCLSYWNRYNQNEKKVILETKTLRMALSHIVIRSVFCYVYMTFSHFWEKVLLISANIYLFEYSIQHYSYTLLYIGIHFSQFKLNFFSMPSLSDFCMLIPQQASTTQVRTAEEINTKTGGIFYERNQKHKNHCRGSWIRQH